MDRRRCPAAVDWPAPDRRRRRAWPAGSPGVGRTSGRRGHGRRGRALGVALPGRRPAGRGAPAARWCRRVRLAAAPTPATARSAARLAAVLAAGRVDRRSAPPSTGRWCCSPTTSWRPARWPCASPASTWTGAVRRLRRRAGRAPGRAARRRRRRRRTSCWPSASARRRPGGRPAARRPASGCPGSGTRSTAARIRDWRPLLEAVALAPRSGRPPRRRRRPAGRGRRPPHPAAERRPRPRRAVVRRRAPARRAAVRRRPHRRLRRPLPRGARRAPAAVQGGGAAGGALTARVAAAPDGSPATKSASQYRAGTPPGVVLLSAVHGPRHLRRLVAPARPHGVRAGQADAADQRHERHERPDDRHAVLALHDAADDHRQVDDDAADPGEGERGSPPAPGAGTGWRRRSAARGRPRPG